MLITKSGCEPTTSWRSKRRISNKPSIDLVKRSGCSSLFIHAIEEVNIQHISTSKFECIYFKSRDFKSIRTIDIKIA